MGKCKSFDEAIAMYDKAEAERKVKREELGLLTAKLLEYDSESLGEAVKCYILNKNPDSTTLEAFLTVAKIREMEAECGG